MNRIRKLQNGYCKKDSKRDKKDKKVKRQKKRLTVKK